MIGISIIPVDTDPLRVWTQWNRGMNIFDAPTMENTYFGNTAPKINLGDIDWFGAGAMSSLKDIGPGDLHLFADGAASVTHPNDNVSAQFGFQGLLTPSENALVEMNYETINLLKEKHPRPEDDLDFPNEPEVVDVPEITPTEVK